MNNQETIRVYLKASSLLRFAVFLLDLTIISLVASLFSSLVLNAIKFNSSEYNDLLDGFTDCYIEFSKGNNDAFKHFNLGRLVELYLVRYGITLIFELAIAILYLVILPIYWKGQTLGRCLMRVKVINHKGDVDLKWKGAIKRELLGTSLLYIVFNIFPIITLVSALIASLKGRSIVDLIGDTDLVLIKPIEMPKGDGFEQMFTQNNGMYNQNNQFDDQNDGNYTNNNDIIDAEVTDSINNDNNDDEDEYKII